MNCVRPPLPLHVVAQEVFHGISDCEQTPPSGRTENSELRRVRRRIDFESLRMIQ